MYIYNLIVKILVLFLIFTFSWNILENLSEKFAIGFNNGIRMFLTKNIYQLF